MVLGIRRASRVNLQGSLDRDVYQVLKKLEETVNDGKRFKSPGVAFDAIKSSNSSLSRQKKRILEDSIDRVLQVLKQEEQDSDSEAALETEPETQPKNPEEDRFLLNRQMVKHWNLDGATQEGPRATKKRRIQNKEDDRNGAEGSTSRGSTVVPMETGTVEKVAPLKKVTKASRYGVEISSERCPLGGLRDVYRQLVDEIGPTMKCLDLYKENKYRKTPGMLICGPPGSGKRSLVRNLAAELELPVISIAQTLDEPERMEKNLMEAFDEAMKLAPSIIFIEQLDHYMGKADGNGLNETSRRNITQFTKGMQRIAKNQPSESHVLALATTSRMADIDQAVLKTGLFEHTFQIKAPDAREREEIFQLVIGETATSDEIELANLAKLTHGYVGADVVNIVTAAQRLAATRAVKAVRDERSGLPANVHGDEERKSGSDPMDVWASASPGQHALLQDDFLQAFKGFTPTLRKEGFTVIPDVTWESVGAMEKVREQLHMSIIGPIKNPELYLGFGLTRPAGVLLWGPPGCGKTLVAQAVANAAQASFILINGPELLNKYVGESERAVRELFQRARSSTPCILFFDEIDSLVPRRDNASTEAGARVVNALLTELDGARDRRGIYVIGTTNRPDMIDAAMLRPGRLSERLFVDLPTATERVEILRAIYRTSHSRALTDKELARVEEVARDSRCDDFSGADLGGLHIKAAECALRKYLFQGGKSKQVSDEDWEHALENSQRSVLNPESYRKLESKLGKAR